MYKQYHPRLYKACAYLSTLGLKLIHVSKRTPAHDLASNCAKPSADRVLTTKLTIHYNDVIIGTIASQITSLTTVYSTVYSDAEQRKHESFASLAFVRGIHRGPVNSPHKWPITRKMFPFDDVIMVCSEPVWLLCVGPIILWLQDDVIQNGRRDLEKSRRTLGALSAQNGTPHLVWNKW